MSTNNPFLCDCCNNICPNSCGIRKSYFSTTEYGGKLCTTACCIKWIITNRKRGMFAKKVGVYDGKLKIVHTTCL